MTYVTSVITVSVVISFALSLLPEDSLSRSVRTVAALIVTLTVLSPLIQLVKEPERIIEEAGDLIGEAAGESAGDAGEWIIDESAENIELGIRKLISDKFGYPESDLAVALELDSSDPGAIVIVKVTVTLYGEALWADPEQIEEYIRESFAIPARVVGGRR